MTVGADQTAGFSIRQANFDGVMEFFAPGLKRWETAEWKPASPRRFLPISVTGGACALQCDHCQAKVLKGMVSVKAGENLYELAERMRSQGTDGILVSGGSTKSGGVPLLFHLDHIARVREELGMKVVVHSGVVSPPIAEGLAEVGVDGVMLDIIGSDDTIHDVYHLDLTTADFEESLRLLAEHDLRIIPHIVLGMHYGEFRGEHYALEMIGRYPVSTLIIVILVPLVGTPMEHIPPPPLDQCVGFFETARHALPDTKINLGCGRPMGEMKKDLDWAAIDYGLNGIAYPADGAIAYAESRGLRPELYEYCCSLTWVGDGASYQSVQIG